MDTSQELDSDALAFLEDLMVDDEELVQGQAVPMLDQHHGLISRPLEEVSGSCGVEELPLDLFPLSDDEDASNGAVSKPTATTETNATATLKAKRKKPNRSPNYDPNRARNMRRLEIASLREKVAEMENELARLREPSLTQLAITSKVSRLTTTLTNPTPLGPSLVSGQNVSGMGVWERTAARQLNERKRAERENGRLKIVLETQLKIAKSLEHLLHKRTTMQGFDECGLNRQLHTFAHAPNQSDAGTFQSLLELVHMCYLDADKFFHNFGIGASEASCHDARIRDGTIAEVFANDVLPFRVHVAGKAAWRYFSHHKNHLPFRLYHEQVTEVVGLPQDTIVEKSGLELQVGNTKATFNLKQVIRRYVEPDRVVIAYSAMSQPLEFAGKPVSGFDFREWGCMVLKKPQTLDADGYSVLQSCYFIRPIFHGHSDPASRTESHREERDSIVALMTEFELNSVGEIMGAWLQMIENILVDEQAASAAQCASGRPRPITTSPDGLSQ